MQMLRLRELREAKDMSQQQFALAMGVRPSVVSNWEHETALPRTRQLPSIAQIFGCSIDDLYTPEYRPT